MLRWLLLMLVVLLVFAFGAALCSFPTGKVCHPSVFGEETIEPQALPRTSSGAVGGPWCPSRLLLVLGKGPWPTWDGSTDGCNWVPVRRIGGFG